MSLLLFAGALALSSSTLPAAETPLTLAGAQQLAVAHSRQLSAQDMAITASREMAAAAAQLPDPVLTFGLDNLPANGPDQFSVTRDFMTMRRIGLTQEMTRSDKRQLRAEHYHRTAEKSLAEKAIAVAAILRDTALAWLDRYYLEQMAAVIAEQTSQAQREIQAAESAYRAGRGTQADVFAARNAMATANDRASEIQSRIRNAQTMLARWTGSHVEIPLAGTPAIDSIRLDPAALDTQLTHHPQIAVLTRQEEIAAAEAKLTQASKKADWSVGVAFQQRGPAYSNMISVGVSLPLQWDQKNRQDRELASKLALVEQAKAERDEVLRNHVAETRSMLTEWENKRERHARYESELLPLANDRTQALVTAYRGGKASLPELLAARRNEIEVRLQALQLQMDTARLWAQLNFLFPDDSVMPHPSQTMHRESQ
jgi:outer membrane protein TolC